MLCKEILTLMSNHIFEGKIIKVEVVTVGEKCGVGGVLVRWSMTPSSSTLPLYTEIVA